jgi:hypothetical protein
MKTLNALVLSLLFLNCSSAFAASLSYSGVEVDYDYAVSFRTVQTSEADDQNSAENYASFHAAHVFGLFHSPDYAKKFGYTAELIEGFAGTKAPQIIEAEMYSVPGDKYKWVRYRAKSQMIVLKKIAAQWFQGKTSAQVNLPLLQDLSAIYVDNFLELPRQLQVYRDDRWVKCTDNYYQGALDFSYFYNPFRCPSLGRPPRAVDVTFNVQLTASKEEEKARFPHRQIYGDNENGNLTTLYFVQGFDYSPEAGSSPQKIRADVGYRVFRKLETALLEDYGFTATESLEALRQALGADFAKIKLATPVHLTHFQNRLFFRTFYKKVDGKIFVVRAGLLNSDDDARMKGNVSFIKFWKEAWENGDFVYFGGHSGDGASLDVDTINTDLLNQQMTRRTALDDISSNELSAITFSEGKTQVAFIDTCTSYDHYQSMYAERKKNLHLMTYGLVSLFHNAEATLRNMLNVIVIPKKQQPLWSEVLRDLESDQLTSHILDTYYDKAEAKKVLDKYRRTNQLPSYLVNVSVPH